MTSKKTKVMRAASTANVLCALVTSVVIILQNNCDNTNKAIWGFTILDTLLAAYCSQMAKKTQQVIDIYPSYFNPSFKKTNLTLFVAANMNSLLSLILLITEKSRNNCSISSHLGLPFLCVALGLALLQSVVFCRTPSQRNFTNLGFSSEDEENTDLDQPLNSSGVLPLSPLRSRSSSG